MACLAGMCLCCCAEGTHSLRHLLVLLVITVVYARIVLRLLVLESYDKLSRLERVPSTRTSHTVCYFLWLRTLYDPGMYYRTFSYTWLHA